MVPDGMVPDGEVPDGMVPVGEQEDGEVPDGMVPVGMVQDGEDMVHPDGTVLGGDKVLQHKKLLVMNQKVNKENNKMVEKKIND